MHELCNYSGNYISHQLSCFGQGPSPFLPPEFLLSRYKPITFFYHSMFLQNNVCPFGFKDAIEKIMEFCKKVPHCTVCLISASGKLSKITYSLPFIDKITYEVWLLIFRHLVISIYLYIQFCCSYILLLYSRYNYLTL